MFVDHRGVIKCQSCSLSDQCINFFCLYPGNGHHHIQRVTEGHEGGQAWEGRISVLWVEFWDGAVPHLQTKCINL